MTTRELRTRADEFRKAAGAATTASDRAVLLRKARNYYEDAGRTGMARWCERFLAK